MRQLDNAAFPISDRGYVAHFSAREQPLILGVITGYGVDEVHIFHRREPVNLEIAEAPEMQAFGQHGMDSAVEFPLFIRVPVGTIGEMLCVGYALAVAGAGDGCYDAPDQAREANLIE